MQTQSRYLLQLRKSCHMLDLRLEMKEQNPSSTMSQKHPRAFPTSSTLSLCPLVSPLFAVLLTKRIFYQFLLPTKFFFSLKDLYTCSRNYAWNTVPFIHTQSSHLSDLCSKVSSSELPFLITLLEVFSSLIVPSSSPTQVLAQCVSYLFILNFFFFLAVPHSLRDLILWDHSSPTRDRIRAPCRGSMAS